MKSVDDMMALAREARGRAYTPYSGHAVGAVLRGSSGALYSGCNVENSAYPQSLCAEAGAISAMVRGGDAVIVEILVMGPSGSPCTPCGGCRQQLSEFAAPEVPVHVCDPERVLLESTLGALIPHAFGPGNVQPAPR